MENQVRIVTTKRGYEHIIKGLKATFNSEKILREIINENTCSFYGKNVIFMKWDNPQHYRMIETVIMILMGYRNAYRICVREGNRVTMYSDESMPNEHIDLPMPVMDCKFKDEETIKQLSKFQRNKKTEVI